MFHDIRYVGTGRVVTNVSNKIQETLCITMFVSDPDSLEASFPEILNHIPHQIMGRNSTSWHPHTSNTSMWVALSGSNCKQIYVADIPTSFLFNWKEPHRKALGPCFKYLSRKKTTFFYQNWKGGLGSETVLKSAHISAILGSKVEMLSTQ